MTSTDSGQYDDLYQAWQFTKGQSGHNPQLSELKQLTWEKGVIVTHLFRAGWWPFYAPDPAGDEPARGMAFMIEAYDGSIFTQVYP